MDDNLVLRRLLWALTSAVLAIGLMAIPVVGDDGSSGDATDLRTEPDGDRGGTGPELAPAGTAPAPAAGEADAGGGDGGDGGDGGVGAAAPDRAASSVPTTSAPPAATAPTTPPTFPPAPTDLGAPQDPGPPVAPRVGVYRYRTTGGDEGERETTIRVEERGRSGDEVRLTVTIAGGDATITNEETWRPEGVRTLRSAFTFGQQRADCDWEPDVTEAVYPLRPGATWSSDSSCTITFGAATVIVKRTARAEVVDLRRVRVAGEVVDVWAIRRVEQLSGAGQSGETTALALFSPKYGIDVDVQGTANGGGRSGDYRQELLRLQPDPL